MKNITVLELVDYLLNHATSVDDEIEFTEYCGIMVYHNEKYDFFVGEKEILKDRESEEN